MTNSSKATETKDIFTRIAGRDAQPAKRDSKLVKRWAVMGFGRQSAYYTDARARRALRLARRMGVDAYMSCAMVRV